MIRIAWLALFIVVAIACAGEVNGGDGADGSLNAAAQQFCVQETNRYRAMTGHTAVQRSTQLETFANTGAMVDHAAAPHDHFRQTHGGEIAFAENECPRWDVQQSGGDLNQLVAKCIAAFYSEGPGGGHYENLLGDYGSLGCGIFQSGTSVTIIQDFGR
jgi:hypothetical protein